MPERRCPGCGSKGVVQAGWAARVIDRRARTRLDGGPPIKVLTTVPVYECLKCRHRWEEP